MNPSRVIRFHQLGAADVLQVEHRSIPTPAPGEVLIAVEAIGMNRADIMFRRGNYLERAALPSSLGFEAAGTVETVGDDVHGIQPGDRVAVLPGFDLQRYSTYADHVLMPERFVLPIPSGLSAIQAAALWMASATAYGGLVEAGALLKGQTVLITAASSSVGVAAIQMARHVGAHVLTTTMTGTKREALMRAGAHAVIATSEESLADRLSELAPKGLDLVFDAVAGPDIETFAGSMRHGGRIVVHGFLSDEATPFPVKAAIRKGLLVRGYVYTDVVNDKAASERMVQFVMQGVEEGSIAPPIDGTFDLSDVVEATRYLESNRQVGKVVLTTSR